MARILNLRKFGFTLVELVVVITILAILATIGFLALWGYSQDAKDSAIKANARSVQSAISAESAITGNSPRYYVVHDNLAALTGSTAVVYVDGNPITLSWGSWNQAGTNYSAGNPDYSKLKLNPEKFRTSYVEKFYSALAIAYDVKYLLVGAMDFSTTTGWKTRAGSYFQVAGIAPATGKASVSWNYPTSSGSVAGLIASDPSKNATWAIVDGVAGSPVSTPSDWTISVSFRWANITGVPVTTTWEAACQKCRDLWKRVITECQWMGGSSTNYVDYQYVPSLSYASNCMHNEAWTIQTTEKIFFPDKRTSDADACTTNAVTGRSSMSNYTYGYWSSKASSWTMYDTYWAPNGTYYLACN